MKCQEFQRIHDLWLDVEAGRGRLPAETAEAASIHARTCPLCRAESEADEALGAALRALPLLKAPATALAQQPSDPARMPAAALPAAGLGRRAPAMTAFVAAAAALAATVAMLPWLSERDGAWRASTVVPAAFRIEAEGATAVPAPPRRPMRPGLRLTAEARALLRPADGVRLRVEPGALVELLDRSMLRLERGALEVEALPGEPFTVKTRLGDASVRGGVFVVALEGLVSESGEARPGQGGRRETEMSGNLRVAAIAAAMSVVVSSGTVAVYSAFGSTRVGPGEGAVVEEGKAPEVVRMLDDLRAVRKELAEVKAGLASAEGRARKVEKRVEDLARSPAPDAGKSEAKPAAPADPEGMVEKVAADFEELGKMGAQAYTDPGLKKLVDGIKSLGERGKKLLHEELASEDKDHRFLAAAVLEKLKDPAFIGELEKASLEDSDFMVRRMASHALAFSELAEAGDSLVKIVQAEAQDPGVRLNAWFGVARLKRPEASPLLEKIIDESAGGTIGADFVLENAIMLGDPALYPALRASYDKPGVSMGMKARIVRVLGKAASGEYREFIAGVAADAQAPEELRKAAQEAAGR